MKLYCILHEVFHIYCLGCGGSRAICELMHLHLGRSFLYNPVPICGLVYLCVFLGTLIKERTIHIRGKYSCVRRWALILMLVFFIGYGLFRDILLVFYKIDLLGDFQNNLGN